MRFLPLLTYAVMINPHTAPSSYPFDQNCIFVNQYFGKHNTSDAFDINGARSCILAPLMIESRLLFIIFR